MEPATLKAMCAALESGAAGVLVIEMASGRSRFIQYAGVAVGPLATNVREALSTGRAFEREVAGQNFFFKPLGTATSYA
ncbi:MAG: hypothetical protein AAFR71_09465 [Pseudomonadota bacterium]